MGVLTIENAHVICTNCPFAFLPFAGTNVDVKMKDRLHWLQESGPRMAAAGWQRAGMDSISASE